MARIQDIALYVRSKNAGPFWTTLEIFCDDEASYRQIKSSPKLNKETVAALYGVAGPERVKEFFVDNIRVIKYSFPRPNPSGHKYENDMHSGQQYIRLAELEL